MNKRKPCTCWTSSLSPTDMDDVMELTCYDLPHGTYWIHLSDKFEPYISTEKGSSYVPVKVDHSGYRYSQALFHLQVLIEFIRRMHELVHVTTSENYTLVHVADFPAIQTIRRNLMIEFRNRLATLGISCHVDDDRLMVVDNLSEDELRSYLLDTPFPVHHRPVATPISIC